MIADNPAARLLAVLEAGATYPPTQNCRHVWRKLLSVDNENDALLMSRLGKLMELPQLTIQIMTQDFPNQVRTFPHWNSQVNQAFSLQNINGEWRTFQEHIDPHTINYLRLTADLLQTKLPTKLLDDAIIKELRENISQLYNEVIESDFEPAIKQYVARYLQRLIVNLDEYRLTGSVPIIESIEIAFGHAFFDAKYLESLSKTSLGRKIFDVLSGVSSVVTIALGIPQLTNSVQSILGIIDK